ncbi:NUDIX hydrolase [Belnapia sp. T18]|uniref:GDP-mannose pyrophosphatase n=2 Tax=Belnapia arida TaxID=2804533 RepID=A0ABS1UDE5_9PROT|nr:NUDIX hydrolase [Belnapia arida]MBL6082711.1 NUDIX hydrolase [Belnapia arida]
MTEMKPIIEQMVLKHQRWSRLFIATIRLPNDQTVQRDVEDHGQAVAVLPFDPQRRTALLVRQFRAPPFYAAGESEMLELPAGRLDEDDPSAGARRETLEEIGLRLGKLELVMVAWTMPALSTERVHLFLAPYHVADRVAKGGGLADEHEDITVAEIPLAKLAEMADRGALTELKLFALVQTLRLRRPELFTAC